MNIKEFSKLTGLSSHTLRYYEKIGLLKNIERNSSGQRMYTTRDADWVGFVVRLKETAMPLETILEYAAQREIGPTTVQSRQGLLEAHQITLKKRIDSLQSHLLALDNKIQLYRDKKVR